LRIRNGRTAQLSSRALEADDRSRLLVVLIVRARSGLRWLANAARGLGRHAGLGRRGWRSSGGRGGANGDAEGACRATVVVLVYCSVKEKRPDSLVAWVKKYTKHEVLDWS
jgi:hypothetical protein